MTKTHYLIIATVLIAVTASLTACISSYDSVEKVDHDSAMPIHVAQFSKEKTNSVIPVGWEELSFPSIEQHSVYSLVEHENQRVVKAVSNASASGIIKKVSIDPTQFPILKWRWNIKNILQKADINTKQGDDYPARIYITFDYDINKLSSRARFKAKMYALLHGELPPLATINYVWDNRSKINTIQSSAYTDRVKMIVVQSGASKLNQWLSEERNIVEDYKAAFGEEPSFITAVAIMTDSDNTGEKATAYFGDISFHPIITTTNNAK